MRSEMSVVRGMVMIVVVGTVLGLAYNGAGLMSRPPRGIPWLAVKADLPDLDSVALPDSGGIQTAPAPGASDTAASAAPLAVGPPAVGPPAAGQPASGRPASPSHSARDVAPLQSAARPPAGAESTSTAPAGTRPPAAHPAAPVPFIPEMDQPVQIKLATAKSLFDAGAALFLDARDAGEYDAGHIPGAMRLTRDDALSDPERTKALAARGRPIVTYCEGGACESSLDLARALVDAGYRKVLVFSGGFPEWAAAGHPVERGEGGR